MTAARIRIAALVAGIVVSAIGFLVSTRVLDVALEVPAGPGGGVVPLTLPRIIGVTLLFIVIGIVVALMLERRAGNPQKTWMIFAILGLIVSMVPTAMLIDDLGARGILAIIHLAVGMVVIPPVASTLPETSSASPTVASG